MNKQARDIINDVFAQISARGDSRFYPRRADGAGCPHADKMRSPRGAGDKCYLHAASAFRLTGDDPGQSVAEPVDVPQDLIRANRETFIEGLQRAFPDEAMRDYFKARLADEPFDKTGEGAYNYLYSTIKRDFPAIKREPPSISRAGRSVSMAHDLRPTLSGKAEDVFKPRHDRQQLSHASTLFAYKFLREKPELYLAFKLWQDYISDYCGYMGQKIYEEAFPAADGAFSDYDDEVIERYPLYHTVSFTQASIVIPQQILFYASAVLGNSAMAEGIEKPDAAKMIEGLQKMRPAGFFRRAYESEWGPKKIICPFGDTAVRWLTMDLGENGDPEDSMMAQCLDAVVKAAPESEHLQAAKQAVSSAIDDVIKSGDYDIQRGTDKLHISMKASALKPRQS